MSQSQRQQAALVAAIRSRRLNVVTGGTRRRPARTFRSKHPSPRHRRAVPHQVSRGGLRCRSVLTIHRRGIAERRGTRALAALALPRKVKRRREAYGICFLSGGSGCGGGAARAWRRADRHGLEGKNCYKLGTETQTDFSNFSAVLLWTPTTKPGTLESTRLRKDSFNGSTRRLETALKSNAGEQNVRLQSPDLCLKPGERRTAA